MESLPPLPYPPSANTYYRFAGSGHAVISPKGRAYRQAVAVILAFDRTRKEPHAGPLSVTIRAFRPDKRIRDIDNILKSLLDSVKHAGVFFDDSQIEHIDARLLFSEKSEQKGTVEMAVGPLLPSCEPARLP